jgi:hypothetical protein
MSERERQASAEIQVTPEMVRAGAHELFCTGYGPGDDRENDIVVKVYRAMESARRAEALSIHGSPALLAQSSDQDHPG